MASPNYHEARDAVDDANGRPLRAVTPPGDKMPATENGIAESVLAGMEARAHAATPGPWRASLSAPMIHGGQYEGVSAGGTILLRLILPSFKSNGPDAEFIAHCRTDVPALIAEVRRLSRLSLYDPRTHVCIERGQESKKAEDAAWRAMDRNNPPEGSQEPDE